MGFSTIAGFTLLFIVSLVIFGYTAHVIVGEIKDLSKLSKLEDKRKIKLKNSDFKIVKITAINTSTNTYDLTVVVENTGVTTFDCDKFTILVDGKLVDFTANKTKLYPLDVVEFTSTGLSGTVGSQHRLVVVSDNGLRKIDTFVVTTQ